MSAIIAVPFILLMLLLLIRESRVKPRRLTQLERRRFDQWIDDHEVHL